MKNRIIYLAGGNSVRFGSNKLLYEYNGKPLYRYTLDVLINIVNINEDYSLTIVTQYQDIKDHIDIIENARINAILDADCRLGASYSIKAGISSLPDEDAYDTFIVADQPELTRNTLMGLMEGTIKSGKITGCIRYEGMTRNPVMFHSSLESELLQLNGDEGGRKVLKKHLDDCYYYDIIDKNEIIDIDEK